MEKMISRKIHLFNDNVSTDQIIPMKYKIRTTKAEELAQHAMEGIDVEFSKKVKKGDFLVAGENFGCGSSREQAPLALKGLGIKVIIAKSFARIFFRNAINLGLIVVENREVVENTRRDDTLEVNLSLNYVENLRLQQRFPIKPLPQFLSALVEEDGAVAYYKKVGKFPW